MDSMRSEYKGLWKKYQSKIYAYLVNLVILLVFWGGMIRRSFNADTIYHTVVQDADVVCNVKAGRYLIALCDFLFLKLGIRTTTYSSITMLLTLMGFAAAMTLMQEIFKAWCPKEDKERMGYCGMVTLVFLNVLFAELLMFSEYCIYYALGYSLAVYAVKDYKERKYIRAVIDLILASAFYQYTLIFAAILTAFFICMEERSLSKKAVLREATAIAGCILAGVLNLLSMWALKACGMFERLDKDAGVGNLKEKCLLALGSFERLYRDGGGILPNLFLPFFFTLFLWGMILISCRKEKNWKILPLLGLVWLGSHVLMIVIPMANETFYFPPRMSFCFYLIQGLLAAAAYVLCRQKGKALLTAGCISYLLIQLLFSDFVVTNHFVSNTLDKVYAKMAYEEILKYEEETGNQVTKLAVVKDGYAPDHYDEVSYSVEQINERALGMVTNSLMEVVTGRYFEPVDGEEEIIREYFEGKDWNVLDLSEQMVILGDTAYWCIF